MTENRNYYLKKYAAVMLLFLSGSITAQQVHKDVKSGFEITVPDDWLITKWGSKVPFLANYGINSSLTVDLDVDEFWKTYKFDDAVADTMKTMLEEGLSKLFKNVKILDYGLKKLDEHVSSYILYNYDGPNGQTRLSQYIVMNEDKRYIITIGCLESEKDSYDPVFAEMLNSFKFIK